MQSPATLIEYISTLDIVIFFGVPLFLLITVLAQEIFAASEARDLEYLAHSGSRHGLPTRS